MDWHVFRTGSNSANQNMTHRMWLGIVEADDKDQAKEVAEDTWTFYNNQFIEVYRVTGSWRGLPKGYWDLIDGEGEPTNDECAKLLCGY